MNGAVGAGRFVTRAGATLMELLVVIAILGIAMALLLPAVQMARETARRITCQSQLRQLGIGLHAYHDAWRALPISIAPWGSGSGRPAAGLSGKGWIVSVLPQLEQQALFDAAAPCFQGDFLAGGGMRSITCQQRLMRIPLPLLHCPSDPAARELSTSQFEWEGQEAAVTSYKGVLGDHQLGESLSRHRGTIPDCHQTSGCNGLFFRTNYLEPQTLAGILDGASNTWMVGEDVVEQNDHSAAYYSNGDWCSCHGPLNYFPSPPAPRDWWDVMTFRSRHPGGAQFVAADGAVRFVSATIAHDIYRGLCTKAGGEVGDWR